MPSRPGHRIRPALLLSAVAIALGAILLVALFLLGGDEEPGAELEEAIVTTGRGGSGSAQGARSGGAAPSRSGAARASSRAGNPGSDVPDHAAGPHGGPDRSGLDYGGFEPRALDYGSFDPAAGPLRAPPGHDEAVLARLQDPQRFVSDRTTQRSDAGVGGDFSPLERMARVQRVAGDSPVAEGARCAVRFLPVETNGFNCLVRVLCEGVVLYPNAAQTAGYAPCEVVDGVPIRAIDEGVTPRDGDPTLDVDIAARRLIVTDGGPGSPQFEATLTLEPAPRTI